MRSKIFLTTLIALAFLVPEITSAFTPPELPKGCCAFKSRKKQSDTPSYFCFNRENRHPAGSNISFLENDCTSNSFTVTGNQKLISYINNTYSDQKASLWLGMLGYSEATSVQYYPNSYCNNYSTGNTPESVCVTDNSNSKTFTNNFNAYCTAVQCEKEPNKETAVTPATTPRVNLVQLGLKQSETGYFMDNCIKDGNCSVCAVIATIAYIISWLFKIGVLGAFLMVTRYGFMLLTSAGKPEKVKEAKSGITGTLIGLVLLFSGWTIVNSVFSTFIAQDPSANVSIFNDGKKWYQFCEADTKPKK